VVQLQTRNLEIEQTGKESRNSIKDIWGERTPHRDEEWPERED